MKRILSVLAAVVLLLSLFTVAAAAEPAYGGWWGGNGGGRPDGRTVKAKFYLLNEGLTVPTGTAAQPAQNYSYVGDGWITTGFGQGGYFNDGENGVSSYVVSAPAVGLEDGQSVIWYVIKYDESDGWHVDGVVTPFCSVLYDGNATGVTGSTHRQQPLL